MTGSALATTGSSRTITYAWLGLSAMTVLSWWLAPGRNQDDVAVASVPITVTVALLAFVKGRMIIRYFMEVRTAPRWLKAATDTWLTMLWLAIVGIYLF
jgi:LPXTG-motif cell wall-anchored protein